VTLKVDILTLFPELFESWLKTSLIASSQKEFVSLNVHDLKKFSGRDDGRVDDRPFGGGPGMLFRPEVVMKALESIDGYQEAKKIHLSPAGRVWKQAVAQEHAEHNHLILLCSRYEGVDQRALDLGEFEDISLGDFVSMGGEAPAMMLAESVIRLIPGVLGHGDSAHEDSFSEGREGLLDCPHYTRPSLYREISVPEVLLSGHHEKIKTWRQKTAYERSRERRSDLIE
jgi:tRNA (guanine37-N1)-methyltransferase